MPDRPSRERKQRMPNSSRPEAGDPRRTSLESIDREPRRPAMTGTVPVATLSAATRTARLDIEPLRSMHAPALFPVLADPRIYAYVPDRLDETVESLADRFAILERGAPAGTPEVWLNWA